MTNDLLKNIYLFKGLPAEEIAQIGKLATFDKVQSGGMIFSQGEEAKAFFVVKHGSVRIRQNTPTGETVDIAVLGTGSHFGEMAFINNEKRTASAEAVETTEVLKLEFRPLAELLDKNAKIAAHFYKAVAKFLCGRLAMTTKDLSFSREKIRSHG